MLDDPRLWLYFTLFFVSAGSVRFLMSLIRKKRCMAACVYISLSLVCMSAFWLISRDFSFQMFREGGFFFLSALIPGILAGLHDFFILLPVPAVFACTVYFGLSVSPLFHEEDRILGSLICYPSSEARVFVEWTGKDGKPVLGYLEGENCSVIVRRTVLPDYLFFLENPWDVLGLTSESINLSEFPYEKETNYIPIHPSVYEGSNTQFGGILKYEYPALRFLDPGYFNSYTYILHKNRALRILERKMID